MHGSYPTNVHIFLCMLLIANAPECSINATLISIVDFYKCETEQETINMSCSVVYKGNVAPVIWWYNASDNGYGLKYSSVEDVVRDQRITSVLTISPRETSNGTSFICEILAPRQSHRQSKRETQKNNRRDVASRYRREVQSRDHHAVGTRCQTAAMLIPDKFGKKNVTKEEQLFQSKPGIS